MKRGEKGTLDEGLERKGTLYYAAPGLLRDLPKRGKSLEARKGKKETDKEVRSLGFGWGAKRNVQGSFREDVSTLPLSFPLCKALLSLFTSFLHH